LFGNYSILNATMPNRNGNNRQNDGEYSTADWHDCAKKEAGMVHLAKSFGTRQGLDRRTPISEALVDRLERRSGVMPSAAIQGRSQRPISRA
jgi:hypothetical protein